MHRMYRVIHKFSDTWNELFVVNWFISKMFWGNTKWKKVSSPHYLKILMKLSKHGISYSLKHWSLIIFQTKCCLYSSQQYLDLNEVSWNIFFNFASSLKKLKLNINRANTQIGIKCDFRDWTRITFEVVANAMFD